MTKRKSPRLKETSIGSLNQWALASFLVVILPLIVAIFYTVSEVGNYTDKSQSTLFKAVHETESSRIILERLASMERNIRQIQLFGKSVFYKLYQDNRAKFLHQMESLSLKDMDEQLITQLSSLKKNENKLYLYILAKLEGDEIKLSQEDLNAFDQLTQQARVLLAEGEERVRSKAALLSITAKQVNQKLIYLAFVSVLLALLFAFLFIRLLTRPIKDIALAIRTLGDDGFDQAIAIRGPNDLQKLGAHLEWLRVKLDNLENEKQQFIRNVSHELKTPLATLKEGTDLLSDNVVGELNEEQRNIIQLMQIGNITINELVENLLEYQRSISSKIIFNRSTFQLESLIERTEAEYELLLRSKNIRVTSQLHATSISADYEKLRIIFNNVFSNALKFSPENASIGLSLSSENRIITLLIEDQGPGVDEKIQPLIFKDFYHGHSTPSWKIKASGLGLALVKHYLDAHQGTIKLLPASKSYCGARFSIHLPQA